MLVENNDNDWGRSYTYNRKSGSPRIDPCGTRHFNVPVSEKTLSIQTKNFRLER